VHDRHFHCRQREIRTRRKLRAAVRQRLRDEKPASGADFYTQACSELSVLSKLGCGWEDAVLFLSSETSDGKACADLLRETVKHEFGAEGEHRPCLDCTDAARFRHDGIRNLFQRLNLSSI
jgi:hypothetical protein